jgi:hypothetical protein
MRVLPVLILVVFPLACSAPPDPDAPAEDPARETTLAHFAGTWDVQVDLEGVDEPVSVQLSGSASDPEWTMIVEGRDPIPTRVRVESDSLIGESAPFESILRAGVMVRARTAGMVRNDQMTGTAVVTYMTESGEESVRGTTRGRRIP